MPRRSQARELGVWANGVRVGDWRLPGRGAMEFAYHESWLNAPESRPLSLSMPLTLDRVPHKGKVVEGYFDNLLPDNDAIRRRLRARFHTETDTAFDLLGAVGRDCVGALQILPAGEKPEDIRKIDARPLNDAEIARELFGIASPASLLHEQDEFRISIAGAQEKTAFLRNGGRWCRPIGSTPTTHIFKLPLGLVGNRRADMRTSVENEWLCARIAAAYGLPVASCEIGVFETQKSLIVERFDRQLHSSGRYWLRLMQEDFAQATGTPWHRKYQADGGPGLADIARILRGSAEAHRDLESLFRAQILFYLLAATDGHAKNFSIRILAGGRFQLTPLYDVLSAWPVVGKKASEIPYEKAKLAMALPGERPRYLLASVQRRHFETLGKRLGIAATTDGVIEDMLSKTPIVIQQVGDAIPKGFPQDLARRIFDGLRKASLALATRTG